jgi:hypothetical protein
MALIRELLGDVCSPLYNPNCPATGLHHALQRARAGLTPPPDAANLADGATQRELMNLQTTANGPAKQSATNATERTRVPQINRQNAFKRTDCRDRHEHVNDDPQRRLVDLDQLDAGPGNVSDAEPAGCRRRGLRRRSFLLSALIVIGCAGAARASAATLRVCAHGCAYTEIADAVTAAAPRDHLAVGAGTFEGGFTIARDLTLTGAGAARTTIRGGGPVITLGVAGATSEPTVSIRDVTITGGITRSSFNGTDEALGGGVLVPPSANSGPGATVVISRSVISGNLVAPAASVDAGFSCGAADCQFAHAGGGGVDSWGDVTLRDSVVSDNQAAGRLTSDADGAGIYAQAGSLTVEHTIVTANRAVAAAPDGRYAEGAGIMFDAFFSPGCGPPQPACRLVVRGSTVSANASTLTNTLPAFAGGQLIAMLANAGGIHVGDSIPTTVQNTTIAGNTTTASDPQGEPAAIDAGMIIGDSPLTMKNARVERNLTSVTSATTEDSGTSGTALELDGPATITNASIVGNVTTVFTPDGDAGANGALAVFNFSGDPELVTVRNSVIANNVTTARSDTGAATVMGSGVFNNSLLDMDGVLVTGNVGRADGVSGIAQGAGIWNGVDLSGPPVQLTLNHSNVIANLLTASPAITPQGGGLFTTSPVTLNHTRIALNRPDQCVGCSPSTQPMATHSDQRAGKPGGTRIMRREPHRPRYPLR